MNLVADVKLWPDFTSGS